MCVTKILFEMQLMFKINLPIEIHRINLQQKNKTNSRVACSLPIDKVERKDESNKMERKEKNGRSWQRKK